MLRSLVARNHCLFLPQASSWQEAIRLSCGPLEASGSVDSSYAQLIIDCVERYGPYIIIMPNVCLAHSQEHAQGIRKTDLAFLHLDQPVLFQGEEGPMPVQLIFALSACTPEQHLQTLVTLSDLLAIPGVPERLAQASCPQDLLAIQEEYLDRFQRF